MGMREEGDNMVPLGNDEYGEVVVNMASSEQVQQPHKKLIIGYALTSKKKKSFLQPKLKVLAREKAFPLFALTRTSHSLKKWQGNEWHEVIEGIADLNFADCDGMICVPKQMVVLKDTTSSADKVVEAGLNFPLVAKPLLVDGTAKSHQLFLAYDHPSLAELEPPLVLQEFVNHGGVLFKVFVVGDVIKVVRRFSLPNISNVEKAEVAGVFQFPRVSSAASVDKTNLDLVLLLPPKPLLEGLVRELCHRLGLRLFNIDMIREHGSKYVFYVIDINYFPGYGKMPNYEQIFIDFFMDLAQEKYSKRQCVKSGIEI